MGTIKDKMVLLFNVHVGNMPDNEVQNYIDIFSSTNKLNEYIDLVCIYMPCRVEPANSVVVLSK